MSVPEYVMWSPTSNGDCWVGSGSPAARCAVLGMTNFVQNSSVASGALSSPLAGSGTTPASVKLRQWRAAPAGVGRVGCGASGAAGGAGGGGGGAHREPGAGVGGGV